MEKCTFKVTLEGGLHAYPSTSIINEANQYISEIEMIYRGKTINLKSIMGILSLGVTQGSEIEILANGLDEKEALEGLKKRLKAEGLAEYVSVK